MSSPIFTAFHPHGSALALSAGDGRFKIWDATTGNLRNEMVDLAASAPAAAGHLAMDYTCMAWGALPSNASAKKKKKGVREKGGAAIVVVGTGSGDIIAWDTNLGELKWRTNDCHAGSVKSVSFNKSGQRLYSVGNDGHVCEMDSISGQVLSKFRAAKTPLTCVAVAQDGGSVAVASAEVKLFDLSSQKRIRKFPGHPAPAKSLCFTPDGKYVLSSATGERHVVMWDVEGGKTAAPVTLSVEHPAVAIGVTGFDKDDDVRRVVAVTEDGVAYVWSAPTVADLGSAKPTIIRVEYTGKGSKAGVLAARFLEREAVVLVAHGASVKPHFEKVALSGHEGSSIILNTPTEGALLPAGAAAANKTTATTASDEKVTLLGPDNAGEAAMPRPQIDITPAKKKTKKRRVEPEDDEAQPQPSEEKPDVRTDDTDTALAIVPDNEPTLEEKLIALKVIEEGDAKESAAQDNNKAVVPRADSLQVLLSQALNAEDNALLEKCLNVVDEKVITNTIRRMRPFEAAKFLAVAVSKLEGRPQRALGLVPWVRAVLLQHASFVMTNLTMQPVLTSLYQIIETRLAVFRPLLSLSGRLDLIMAQIQKNEGQGEEEQQKEAAVVYEEEDDEPEAIDVMAADGASQYGLEGEDDDEDSESEDDAEDEDMGDDDEMDEDEPDIKLNGNGNGMSDGEDEDI